MAQRKIFNFESIILDDMTLKNEGYLPGSLGNTSAKFIHATCRFCGEPSRIRKGFFNKSGSACHKECKIKEQSLAGSPFGRADVQAKVRETNLARYGCERPTNSKDIAQKISQTKQKKKRTVNGFDLVALEKKRDGKVQEIIDFLHRIGSPEIVLSQNGSDILVPSKSFGICLNSSILSSEAVLPSNVARTYQFNKTKTCLQNNIRLLHIFDLIWDNRKEQCQSLIRNALGLNENKIAARKCTINYDQADIFVDQNHIQGSCYQVTKWFNLVYDGQFVSSMVAGRHHRQNIEGNPIVLSRFCSTKGSSVQGGASKLFEEFKQWAKASKYDRVLSWSDNSYAAGGLYERLGFTLQNEYAPDYFYWDSKTNQYRSKQSQRKATTACPVEYTENQWAKERGLYRIWDCGKKLWVHNLWIE